MLRSKVLSNSVYSLLAGVFKLTSGFLLLKWAVESFGNENLVFLGHINSIFLISTSLASIGIYSGIVSLAETKRLNVLISSSLKYLMYLMLPSFLLLNGLWFLTVYKVLPFGSVTHIAICLLFLSFPFQHVVLGLINIRLKSKYTYYCRILGSVFVLIIGFFVTRFPEGGYLINALTGTALFLVGLVILFKYEPYCLYLLKNSDVAKGDASALLPFAKVFTFSIFVMPVAKIIVRELFLLQSDTTTASYWQAYLTISDSYTMVFTLFLSSFYLKYASKNKSLELLSVARSVGAILVPLCFIGFVIIYLIFPYLLNYILSFNLSLFTDLRLGIVVGDFFRFMTLLITYNFIVRAYVKVSVFFELLQGLMYISLVCIGFYVSNLTGAGWGYAFTYVVLFIFVLAFASSQKANLSKERSKIC